MKFAIWDVLLDWTKVKYMVCNVVYITFPWTYARFVGYNALLWLDTGPHIHQGCFTVTKKSADYSDVGEAVLQKIGKYIICFPLRRGSAIPTCITARAWRTCRDACRDRYLAVSFEVADGKNVPGIPGACTTRNFTYLARGPCKW